MSSLTNSVSSGFWGFTCKRQVPREKGPGITAFGPGVAFLPTEPKPAPALWAGAPLSPGRRARLPWVEQGLDYLSRQGHDRALGQSPSSGWRLDSREADRKRGTMELETEGALRVTRRRSVFGFASQVSRTRLPILASMQQTKEMDVV